MKVLTANRLSDGEVVFWREGAWVERFAEAEIFTGEDPALAAEAHGKNQPTVVVEPYLIDLTEDETPVPVSYRERIRALGPTNLLHGKQAEGGAVVAALQAAHGGARSSGRVALIKRK